MSERRRTKCVRCGRIVGAYVPRGGDGSAVRAYPHKNGDGEPCDGQYHTVDEWEVQP